MMNKILITGGLGFVGKNLARFLIKNHSSDIILVDDCSNSNPELETDLIQKVRFYKLSVTNKKSFLPLLKEAEYIYHFATRGISSGSTNPLEDLMINTNSSLEILEYLRIEKPKNFKRFIFASTSSIYGNNGVLPFKENGIPHVLNQYAVSKLSSEFYSSLYYFKYNIPTVSLRFSNLYGPGQSPLNLFCGVIGKFMYNALLNQPLVIYNSWKHTRDYTFISDALKAIILCSINPIAIGNIYNVGTGCETSISELLHILGEYIKDIKYEMREFREIDNITRRSVCIDKIKKDLNWFPEYDIKRGMQESISWYKNLVLHTHSI